MSQGILGDREMLIKAPTDIRPSEITPETVYRQRRQFVAALAGAGLLAAARNNFV